MADETHPMFDPQVRDMWKRQNVHLWGGEQPPPGRNAEFYHATNRNLDRDSHVNTPASMGESSRTGSVDDAVWFSTADPASARRTYGRNVYKVQPTGPFTDNFDTPGEFGGYASDHPLRILSKVQFNE